MKYIIILSILFILLRAHSCVHTNEKTQHVKAYERKDGTHVKAYDRRR